MVISSLACVYPLILHSSSKQKLKDSAEIPDKEELITATLERVAGLESFDSASSIIAVAIESSCIALSLVS